MSKPNFCTFLPFLIWLTTVFYLTGCSRHPQAFVQRTPHVSYSQPKPLSETAPEVTADVTASITETPPAPVPAKPVWVESTPSKAATAAPAIPVSVKRPTVWSSVKRMLPRKPAPPNCDQIVLRNGDVIEAKVKEVGVNEIRYKKCDRQDGPDYTISKRDVLSIKYSNGEVERFGNSANNSTSSNQSYQSPTSQNDGPKTDPFAIVAISAGGLALLTGLGSLLFGAAAIVFGAMSLSRIKKQPDRFKGKGLALAGMIVGIVAAAFWFSYVYLF